jgi:uncharacterized protein YbjT (DUF2867 family)
MSKPRALVFGATGPHGQPVVRRLLAMGWRVDAATRSPFKGTMLAMAGATVVPLDLRDGAAVGKLANACDAVFWHMPARPWGSAGRGLANLALDALLACARPRVIFLTAGPVARGSGVPAMLQGVAEAVHQLQPLPEAWTIIRSGLLLDAALQARPMETTRSTGVLRLPLPAEAKIRWSSAELAAEAAVDAVLDESACGQTLWAPATKPADGAALAKALGAALDVKLRYEACPPGAFAAGLLAAGVESDLTHELEALYAWLGEHAEGLTGDEASSKTLPAVVKSLGLA